ncbi:MAG: hypothetical protein HYX41_05020 [Bdellovibrio sp.]|nr:hypothetical protein [Bdellovibrio sp.]
MSKIIRVKAPSNIALVKYMGKKDFSKNLPANSSLSMTLSNLSTLVELRSGVGKGDQIFLDAQLPEGLPPSQSRWEVPKLDSKNFLRIENHFKRVVESAPPILDLLHLPMQVPTGLVLRTANCFPASSGIASSASSFAALTLAFLACLAKDTQKFIDLYNEYSLTDHPLNQQVAALARSGSGSACRSLQGPWVEWSESGVQSWKSSRLPEMAHFVLLVRTQPKTVGSSEAHKRVLSSPLWVGRAERANTRVDRVRNAIQQGDLKILAHEVWKEAWEMHSLFHTSDLPFTYWQGGTLKALEFFSKFLDGEFPPIVTLDAGPNPHLIVPMEHRDLWKRRLQESFSEMEVLEDSHGRGAVFLS